MANILLLSVGSAGDINPFVGLGIALRARGHETTLVANEYFENVATAGGLNFIASGAAAEYERVISGHVVGGRSTWNSHEGMKDLMNYCMSSMCEGYGRIAELQRKNNTVIIGSRFAYASLIAKDKFNLPVVTLLLNMTSLPSVYSPPTGPSLPLAARFVGSWGRKVLFRLGRRRSQELFGRPINEFRESLGLPGIHNLRQWLDSSNLLFAAWPKWLYGHQLDWPKNVVQTGFLEYDGLTMTTEQERQNEEVAAAKDVRPIVFTPGTAVSDAKAFFQCAVEGLTALDYPGILLSPYRDHIPGNLPSFIYHLEFAPLSDLLTKAVAIVHYGGIGTAARALRAGIPQCISPRETDQFDNAQRLERIGVARSIVQKRISPSSIATTLRELLTSKAIAERCQYYANEMTRTDPMQVACDLIDQLCHRSSANACRADCLPSGSCT
jgi:rhamnosyltransferase subunit B